jgi:hypothetical protein
MTSFFAGRIVSGTIVVTVLASGVAAAQAPTLAEVARREQERRKTTPPPTKVLTNKDLPKVVTPPAQAAPPADAGKTDTAANAAPTDAPQAPKEEPKGEDWWRGRISEPRERLHRDEVLLDALQARVNGLTSDFVGRDDPYQRARIGDDRQRAIVEMDRVRAEIVDLKKKIDDIEEEARKASVPPGWLR